MTELSTRIHDLQLSTTQEIHDRAQELARRGVNLVNLGAGDPQFDLQLTPTDQNAGAIAEDPGNYTSVDGLPELKKGLVNRYRKLYQRSIDPQQIVLTSGAKAALFETLQTLLKPGETVLIPKPYWVSYPEQVKLAGGKPVPVEGSPATNFLPSVRQLEASRRENTVAVILNSPSNPTGGIYGASEGKKIISWAQQMGITVISDECYDGYNYTEEGHWSFAQPDRGAGEVVVVGSFSKNFAMTGWRLGYLISNEQLADNVTRFQSHFTSNPSSVAQYHAKHVLANTLTLPSNRREDFRQRRDFLAGKLDDLQGIECPKPPGSFYLFPNVNGLIELLNGENVDSDFDLARFLLDRAGVVTIPGSAFGAPGHLRIAYVRELADLKEATEQIEQTLLGK
ncbi:MAG: pyridoxal phosphate-dependent aminotransferase [Candidatus Bipolaricaulota bacterium]